jgi:hypothetical protein
MVWLMPISQEEGHGFDFSVTEQYKNGIYHLEAVAKLVPSTLMAHVQSSYAS